MFHFFLKGKYRHKKCIAMYPDSNSIANAPSSLYASPCPILYAYPHTLVDRAWRAWGLGMGIEHARMRHVNRAWEYDMGYGCGERWWGCGRSMVWVGIGMGMGQCIFFGWFFFLHSGPTLLQANMKQGIWIKINVNWESSFRNRIYIFNDSLISPKKVSLPVPWRTSSQSC